MKKIKNKKAPVTGKKAFKKIKIVIPGKKAGLKKKKPAVKRSTVANTKMSKKKIDYYIAKIDAL